MRTRTFGPTGVEVPVIGQGTWNMELDDPQSAVRALERGLELGMTHIDTAEMYGSGAVERLVGEALRGRRERAFVVSKVLPHNASRRGTLRACERSLERLGIDELDCYVLHWSGTHPLEDTFAAFEELRQAGKIRSWGVSNFDDEELDRAVGLAGPGKIACDQVLYHLGERAIEHRLHATCDKHGIALVGYSPFGSGDFPASGSAERRVLDDIAEAHGVTAHAVALSFLVRMAPLFTIPKSSQPEHVDANAAAGDLELDEKELATIDATFPRGRTRRGVPMS
jgi:diketogulonate reductase-like aldo/keto reductase